ncbi:MAG TPA: glycosyltransferase family 1 protein [Acidimicrobiales bacterium]|nr:glycosyltransferase family 1 protein [Acidimicrobiales bacterium]
MDDVGSGRAQVLLVAQQLRRQVPGGIGTYVRGLLGGLARLDEAQVELPSVTLYASRVGGRGRVGSGGGSDPLEAFGHRVITSRLPGPLLTRLWDRAVVHAPGGFDLVHSVSVAVPPVKGSRDGRRCVEVVAIHDVAWRHRPEDYPSRGQRWHEAALGRALRHASHFVVPSDAVAADLVKAGAPQGAVSVIPLGSDVLRGRDDAEAEALLQRLGVRGDFLLSVGTLEPRKNLPRLFEAYGAARRSLPGTWPLVVVGPPGWGPELEPGEGVVFTGRVGDGTLASLYARARLLAYVPFEEGFGLPPVEAMRYGTPVVSSPLPTTGGAALEVDPTRVEDIAQALVQVATDDDLRARLAEAGRARAGSLTWESAARAHVALWRSLL